MSHSHRDDFDIVPTAEQMTVALENATPAPAVSNAGAAKEAETARLPREHAFTVGGEDVESAATPFAVGAVDGDAAMQLRRSGPPAPRFPDFRDEPSWARPIAESAATLRSGDDWLSDYGALPAQLADAGAAWLSGR